MKRIRFSRQELLFSLKSFAGAMLALYLANRAGLPRPFWAFMTAYIVAHPLAGNVRSKALYRFVGTLLGCAATVVLIPSLSASPELLSLALALWTGLCLYLSLLDRSARSYVFMLAGYSAALIGFPLVDAPAAMFDTAVARVQEIGLGILCASVVHSIALPASLAPPLLGLVDRALGDARRWMDDLLGNVGNAGDGHGPRVAADRQRLAQDITQLRLLSTHVPFDTGNLRWTAGAVRAMQDRISALTPTLSAMEDRLDALKAAEGELPADVVSALERHASWIAPRTPGIPQATTDEARAAFRALADGPASSPWVRALRIDLAVRLEALMVDWHACLRLRGDIDAGLAGTAPPLRRAASLGHKVLHLDRGLALRSAVTAVLATCACCAVWIATAWPSGSAAAMSAAVFCSFFATMDDPVPAMHKFVVALLWSLPVSVFCVLAVMPLAHDFGMLALCIAPFFLLVGCYIARPASSLAALGMFFGVAGTLALQDTASADLPSLVNSNLALILGAVAAARVTALVRSVGSDWSARRIRRATSLDLADLAARSQDASAHDAYAGRMLDRIAQLAPRTAPDEGEHARAALRDLRVGADLVALQRWRRCLPTEAVGRLLADSARVFRAQAAGAPQRHAALLPQIDRLLLAALHGGIAHDMHAAHAAHDMPTLQPSGAAIAALVGLRRNLFPAAHGALQP
ncbi:FUSC family protein [Variovorax sp. J22G73]|uniref:FUSC family protein n=1 Tax=unclassified Variovorax TaxID=663243 RepID=UPI002574EC9B|nr:MULTISPECIES: FUSC family protein [unclassified Variovorax]MDM0005190.1 FUSC family protein [Variovorax sp. J22R203]MDM0098606.1 FUSC family protein [Variovorax sp. J22G73]